MAFYENALKKSTKEVTLQRKNQDSIDSLDEHTVTEVESVVTASEFLTLDLSGSLVDLSVEQDTSITLTSDKIDASALAPTWWLPLAAIGGYAIRGGGDSVAPSAVDTDADECQYEPLTDFILPAKPSTVGALQITLAAGESVLQDSADALENHYEESNTSLIVTLGRHSDLSGHSSPYAVNASGNMGDIYIGAGVSAQSLIDINVSGDVGDIVYESEAETVYENTIQINAHGDVGDVFLSASGNEAGGSVHVDAFNGDVTSVNSYFANASGGGYLYVSAYNDGSGFGGSIGDVSQIVSGIQASGRTIVQANGGDIGDIAVSMLGGSASGTVSARAFEQSGYGGNIGDIRLLSMGASADVNIYASASHSIGNISMTSLGYSAETEVNASILSGGTVGNIDIQVGGSCNLTEQFAASGRVNIYGSGVSVGNVAMSVYGGLDHSAGFSAGDQWSAGLYISSVGDISFTATSDSYSAHSDISVFTNLSDIENSSVGNITINDTGFNGDHEVEVFANHISGLNAFIGDGSANIRIKLVTAAEMNANVGNISITMGDEHFGSGGHITAMFGVGTQVGSITINGGTEFSEFDINAGGDFTNIARNSVSYSAGYNSTNSHIIGDIDMSEFNGLSNITLATVQTGVRIDVGVGGSNVRGTEGSDEIYLGAGQDTIYFDFFTSEDASDNLYNFDLSEDRFVGATSISSFWDSEEDSLTPVSANALLSLVDKSGGQDLSDVDGLELALMTGGEYAGLLINGNPYTIATASAYDASTFNLYNVWFNLDTAYASLMGVFNLGTGSEFSDLSLNSVPVI